MLFSTRAELYNLYKFSSFWLCLRCCSTLFRPSIGFSGYTVLQRIEVNSTFAYTYTHWAWVHQMNSKTGITKHKYQIENQFISKFYSLNSFDSFNNFLYICSILAILTDYWKRLPTDWIVKLTILPPNIQYIFRWPHPTEPILNAWNYIEISYNLQLLLFGNILECL